MAERNHKALASAAVLREKRVAVLSLLTGALVWGLIWYPYRVLRDAGIDGIWGSTVTYAVAFVFGLLHCRRAIGRHSLRWGALWLALSAGCANLAYVMATLEGEIVRVLLLFYLAPLWTVLLSRLLLGERLTSPGALVVVLSLAGAATILWQPRIGFPVPQDAADWLGLGAGFSFALFNVLSRFERAMSIESKSMVSFAGVILMGVALMGCGYGRPQMPASTSVAGLLVLLGLVLVVANLVVQYGLARVASNRAIVIMLTEVGFGALSSWWLADEYFGLREALGGGMIVAASIFSARMETDENC